MTEEATGHFIPRTRLALLLLPRIIALRRGFVCARAVLSCLSVLVGSLRAVVVRSVVAACVLCPVKITAEVEQNPQPYLPNEASIASPLGVVTTHECE